MKWVKLEKDADPNITAGEMSQGVSEKFIETIPKPKEKPGTENAFSENISARLEKQLSEKFEVWVTHPETEDAVLPNKLGKIATRKYEIFCGGFLYYHDEVFKRYKVGEDPFGKVYPYKGFEHKIFFEWLPKGKGVKKDKVRIYINTTPPEFNPPPKPPPPPPPES